MFRNLTAVLLPKDAIPTPAQLAEAIAGKPLRTPGPLELHTIGFVSPRGRNHPAESLLLADHSLISVGSWQRLLPAQVVNDAVAEQLDKLEAERGKRPGGRERKRIKDDVITELMPRAFLKAGKTDAWLDHTTGLFVVDTASPKAATAVVSEIRDALGSFPATPLCSGAHASSVRLTLTGLVTADTTCTLDVGDEAELRDPADDGAIIRARRQDLDTDEVRQHLDAGKLVVLLALADERVSFTIDDTLVIRKLRFGDVVLDTIDAEDDADAELHARFALMTGELRALYRTIHDVFGLDFDALHLDGNPA